MTSPPTGPSSVAERKRALRGRMRLMRDVIDDRSLRSISLWAGVAGLAAYRDAQVVMAFDGTRGEPDTDSLFARLSNDAKTLVLPRIEPAGDSGQVLVPRLLGDGWDLGRLGIREPRGEVVPVADIDLVIVPGLAFTPSGARLGRGGGHFDRFLPTLGERCATVGVCFVEQLVDELPVEPHDVAVHHVITDGSIDGSIDDERRDPTAPTAPAP